MGVRGQERIEREAGIGRRGKGKEEVESGREAVPDLGIGEMLILTRASIGGLVGWEFSIKRIDNSSLL